MWIFLPPLSVAALIIKEMFMLLFFVSLHILLRDETLDFRSHSGSLTAAWRSWEKLGGPAREMPRIHRDRITSTVQNGFGFHSSNVPRIHREASQTAPLRTSFPQKKTQTHVWTETRERLINSFYSWLVGKGWLFVMCAVCILNIWTR